MLLRVSINNNLKKIQKKEEIPHKLSHNPSVSKLAPTSDLHQTPKHEFPEHPDRFSKESTSSMVF
jgi:hypothetical protein